MLIHISDYLPTYLHTYIHTYIHIQADPPRIVDREMKHLISMASLVKAVADDDEEGSGQEGGGTD